MAKITKLQRYAVLWLSSQLVENQTIATETDLTVKQVSTILNKFKIENPQNKINTTSGPAAKAKSKTQQLMITESVGKRQNVAIMTKEASQVADEERKKFESLEYKKDASHIFRPSTTPNS
jgi:NCAIR mutase (PurE)-related protein